MSAEFNQFDERPLPKPPKNYNYSYYNFTRLPLPSEGEQPERPPLSNQYLVRHTNVGKKATQFDFKNLREANRKRASVVVMTKQNENLMIHEAYELDHTI